MSLRHVFCLFLVAIMPIMGLTAMAEVPDSINYQGILLDSGGDPVTTATTVTFTIYDAESAGTMLWDETKSFTPDEQGRFQTCLGSEDPLDAAVFALPHTFLEVTVSGDPPMPRVPLVTVPYAYHAATVDGGVSRWQDTDSILYTNEFWGIARGKAENALFGDQHHTMVNLGVACTTGTNGQNYTNATVGGGYGNKATNFGTTVAGGDYNIAGNNWATVGGGTHNESQGEFAAVGGGVHNVASGYIATVGGGTNDTASGDYSAVAGGRQNVAGGDNAVVGGGYRNTASGPQSAVAGGSENTASGSFTASGGGYFNLVDGELAGVAAGGYNKARGDFSVIAGGGSSSPADSNQTSGNYSAVGGGRQNYATSFGSVIAGGQVNKASNSYAAVAGGNNNTASGGSAAIGGGQNNVASGSLSAVPGGNGNNATGTTSFAAGNRAKSLHGGAFVWADQNNYDFSSSAINEFAARCIGGIRFVTGIDGSGIPTAGVQVAAGGGSWSSISDQDLKENFSPVDAEEILEKVAALPVSTWNYKAQNEAVRHIGPMAQDLYAAFGVGEDEKRIATIDADGIALAAIQGLYQHLQVQQQENADLKKRVAELESLVQRLTEDKE